MAEFVCRLGTPGGEVVTRTMEATAERDLRTRLEREGYHVFAISTSADGGSRLSKSISKRIKLSDFLTFNQQLSALLRAGIPILQSIQILGKRMKNEQLRAMLLDVEERIKTGESLSSAFASQGEAFPRIYVASVLAVASKSPPGAKAAFQTWAVWPTSRSPSAPPATSPSFTERSANTRASRRPSG